MGQGKIQFIWALHNHQPVGNFEHVVRDCIANAYKPLLETIARYPKVKINLHYSGPLLEFMDRHEPAFIELLAEMIRRGQVEILGSGFYEPVLTAIPIHDARGQVEKMNAWLERRFGKRASGIWPAERVWEPNLPAILAGSGTRYTVLDNSHFLAAGLKQAHLFGYYWTESENKRLALFPASQRLRQLIPFENLDNTFAYFRRIANRGEELALTYADDGAKFGVWPRTHHLVFSEGYLEAFCEKLIENSDWIETQTFSGYMDQNQGRELIYLPTASYPEMMEWSLPYDARISFEAAVRDLKVRHDFDRFEPFLHGGMWKSQLSKYAESNRLHKKMQWLSGKILEMKDHGARAEAQEFLWKSQCNSAYWHGTKGGLYLNHLRHGLWTPLIESEKCWLSTQHLPRVEVTDIDCNGKDEVVAQNNHVSLTIHPAYGGSITECHLLNWNFNLSNTLTRYREPYHNTPGKAGDQGKSGFIENFIGYDWYVRGIFQDHFFAPNTTVEKFSRCNYGEWGDFVNLPFTLKQAQSDNNRIYVEMERDGGLYWNQEKHSLRLIKRIIVEENVIRVIYELINQTTENLSMQFGTEINLTLLVGDATDRYFKFNNRKVLLGNLLSEPDLTGFEIVDEMTGIRQNLTPSDPATFWSFPVETASISEDTLEKQYQGSSITAIWSIELAAGQRATRQLNWEVSPL
ncbi:MAG: alpha-amylase/4-alpha-glucanotransferase domain-containing protein [Verrucomicrobiota bacterium]|nr:alpha-amylase/4-alpha-glucanotransferase domain-containing protein [Verrucomicrobiota bacterium]